MDVFLESGLVEKTKLQQAEHEKFLHKEPQKYRRVVQGTLDMLLCPFGIQEVHLS